MIWKEELCKNRQALATTLQNKTETNRNNSRTVVYNNKNTKDKEETSNRLKPLKHH